MDPSRENALLALAQVAAFSIENIGRSFVANAVAAADDDRQPQARV